MSMCINFIFIIITYFVDIIVNVVEMAMIIQPTKKSGSNTDALEPQ